MKHEIQRFTFGEKGEQAWSIDHSDADGAVSVTPNEGDFLIQMSETPEGFSIPRHSVTSVELNSDEAGFYIYVNYAGGQRLLIGQSADLLLIHGARLFVESLNQAFYEGQMHDGPESLGTQ